MTGLLPSQPSSRELVTTLRDMRTPLACAAAEEISGLREANHHYRDSAARDEKLIATLTARVEALEKTIKLASYALRKASLTDNERIADAQIALSRAVLQPKGAAV